MHRSFSENQIAAKLVKRCRKVRGTGCCFSEMVRFVSEIQNRLGLLCLHDVFFQPMEQGFGKVEGDGIDTSQEEALMRDIDEIDLGRVDEQASAEAEERGRLSRKDLVDGVFKVREALDDVALLPVDEEDVSVATCGSEVCHFREV